MNEKRECDYFVMTGINKCVSGMISVFPYQGTCRHEGTRGYSLTTAKMLIDKFVLDIRLEIQIKRQM